jgi:two-component system, HptB-dependent secretion and biofilm response regulator
MSSLPRYAPIPPPADHPDIILAMKAVRTPEAAAPPSSLQVLAVDDTATNRQILSVFFKRLGHTIDLAENGAQAVAMFARKSYDLVIMDVMMPVMDGFEATRRIKAQSGDRWVPVLFLSALDKDENLVAGLEAGGDDYLPKPVNFVVLEAKLRALSRSLLLRRELEDAQRLNQAITDNLLDAIVTSDEHGVITSVNPACCRIFGYAESEMLGQNVAILMPARWRHAHEGYVDRYVQGGASRVMGMSNRDVEGQRKDGSTFLLSVSLSEFYDRGRRMFVATLRDITEQRQAEQKLSESALALQEYHDEREAENILAQEILDQLMQRPGLNDPSIHYWMNPATNFSGDIVAAARAPDGRFFILLADATGHGLAAAISVLPVLTLFYDVVELGMSLSEIIARINRQLRISLPVGRFVACSCLCIDPQSGQSDIWMGGMPSALLLDRSGKVVREVAAANLPLGIADFDATNTMAQSLSTPPGGGQLVMFSDGLIEAYGETEEQFGVARLRAVLASAPESGRIDAVKDAVIQHLGACLPHDDITLMLVDLPAPRN